MLDLQGLIQPTEGSIWRVVETQEIAATRAITRSSSEQSRLEELLEQSKPPVPADCQGLSYLLSTPFRYPPLDYGSRFGSTLERGIFYGAKELNTALAETAVYLWLFQSALHELGPMAAINDHRTALLIPLASNRSIDFSAAELAQHHEAISSPGDWSYSQRLGSSMRELAVQCFWYPSARLQGGVNAGVISPQAFAAKEPSEQQHWQLKLSPESCWFGRHRSGHEFYRKDFLQGNRLLHPMA
ncbi:RES family NAD+ phosphorylase [Dasania sp. GY-MA-18]|uniref:RES family NAD+ phosphorylase n=1 Tax=Dasania phycosphaerae TaxID=2950436 RepID=A0A9J6RLQ1_9GAMM|nr:MULTISPECIES: RES family NAD+ phosphorylase [Dasania]MCR8922875.1 RES family NAD+ phosphorylase [Dasania sp. GY-MA-18]MCZ0865306.1 RES family NAD+ phosphorylase [Dasania phycosphaerae]MCZ0869031.1 RES family NAD+ phosphorylase [Dasania phycosphaerae]